MLLMMVILYLFNMVNNYKINDSSKGSVRVNNNNLLNFVNN